MKKFIKMLKDLYDSYSISPIDDSNDDPDKFLSKYSKKELAEMCSELEIILTEIDNDSPSIVDILSSDISSNKKKDLVQKSIFYMSNYDRYSSEFSELRKEINDSKIKIPSEKNTEDIINSLNTTDNNKELIMNKYKKLSSMKKEDGEYNKLKEYVEKILKVPFGKVWKYEDKILSVKNAKRKLDDIILFQEDAKEEILCNLINETSTCFGLEGEKGSGKCLGKDTEILMYDQNIKYVQNIKRGDLLMGIDGTPRKVLSTCIGFDDLFKITYNNGFEHFICNKDHLLVLTNKSNSSLFNSPQSYFKFTNEDKQHIIKTCNETYNETDSDKYNLIKSKRLEFENNEIISQPKIKYIFEIADEIYNINNIPKNIINSNSKERELFINAFKFKNIKYIIHEFKKEQVFKDFIFILGSLGINYTIYDYDTEQNVYILSFDNTLKNSLYDFTIEPIGIGTFFGFTLDGDQKFLLRDFTICHNTTLIQKGMSESMGRPIKFISLGGKKDNSFLLGHSYTYEGSVCGKIVDSLIECGVTNPIIYFDELDKISGKDITNTLIHLTDCSQNHLFQDNYFGNITFDLSNILFVFSFNDNTLIDPILLNRLKIIKTQSLTNPQKSIITKNKIIPDILKKYNRDNIIFDDESISYIVGLSGEGVRDIIRHVEHVISRLTMIEFYKNNDIEYKIDINYNDEKIIVVTKKLCLKLKITDNDNEYEKYKLFSMYT